MGTCRVSRELNVFTLHPYPGLRFVRKANTIATKQAGTHETHETTSLVICENITDDNYNNNNNDDDDDDNNKNNNNNNNNNDKNNNNNNTS